MGELAIHVYHSAAEAIGALVEAAAPDREVVVLSDRAALAEALPSIEVLFAPMPPRDGWAQARALRLIQVAGVGVDHFLPAPDLPPEVEVAGARGVFSGEVSEHALMMLLALRHGLPTSLEEQAAKTWRQRQVLKLEGRSLVVLGLGAIGRRIVRLAATVGMHVRGVSRGARMVEGLDAVHPRGELDVALRGADALVVCVPRTSETLGAIDADALGSMAEGALVVDVSRGGVVVAGALLDALASGRVAGAALDVFETEPLPPDSPFWTTPGVIVTPHVAGYGERYIERAIDVLVDNVARLERGDPLTNVVDRDAGY
jgi:phosphoglycerate dehydrogenase-like enzyme